MRRRTNPPHPVVGATAATDPSAPLRLRLVIWVVLVAIVATGILLTSSVGSEPTIGVPGDAFAAEGVPAVAADASPAKVGGLDEKYEDSGSIGLLPAWRWRSNTTLYSNYSTKDAFQGMPIMSLLATLLFAIASWIWWVLLSLSKAALSLDLVTDAAEAINQGFGTFARTVEASGVLIIVCVMALLAAIKIALRGNIAGLVSLLIVFVLPIGAMQALMTRADNTGGVDATGSPAYIAAKGAGFVDTVGKSLGDGFGVLSTVGGQRATADPTAGMYDPGCVGYLNTLYDQFHVYGADTPALTGRSPDSAARVAERAAQAFKGSQGQLSTVSMLWQRSFLANWTQAQFGSAKSAERISCHRLEDAAGISRTEQAALANAAYPTLPDLPTRDVEKNPFRRADGKGHEAQMFMWAACNYEGGWRVQPAWQHVGDITATGDNSCDNWWGGGEFGKKLRFGNDFEGDTEGSFADDTVSSPKNGATVADFQEGSDDDLQDIRNLVRSYRGKNSGERLLAGLVAIITAGVYAYALGAVALGTIIAQFGLVMMLIALPGTLILLAVPSKQGRHPLGMKLLKMTGGFLAAKLSFTVVMVLLLQTILILESIVGGDGGNFMTMLIPLGALFLIRKLIQTTGMGDITKLSGALGMSSAVAVAASGDNRWRAMTSNKIDRAGKRLGLDKLDHKVRAPYRLAERSGLKVASGAAWAGTAAKNRALGGVQNLREKADVSGRLGLPQLRAALVGSRDDQGNLIAPGALQQMKTLAGAASLFLGENPTSPAALWAKKAADRVTGFNKARLTDAEISRNARWQRHREIAATRGKGKEGRLQARQELFSQQHGEMRSAFQAVKGPDGEPMRALDGSIVTGFDDDGYALTDVHEWFDDESALLLAGNAAAMYGISSAHVLAARSGIAPMFSPSKGADNGSKRVIQADTGAKTVEMAKHPASYFDRNQIERPSGMSDTAYNWMIHQYGVATGTFDPTNNTWVDAAHHVGVDLSTAEGMLELEKHMAGQDSVLNGHTYTVADEQYQSIVSAARQMDLKMSQRSDDASPMRALRDETIKVTANKVVENQEQLKVVKGALDNARAQIDAADPIKLEEIVRTLGEQSVQVISLAGDQQAQGHTLLAAHDIITPGKGKNGKPKDTSELAAILQREAARIEAEQQLAIQEIQRLQVEVEDALGSFDTERAHEAAQRMIEINAEMVDKALDETAGRLADHQRREARNQADAVAEAAAKARFTQKDAVPSVNDIVNSMLGNETRTPFPD